MAGEATCLSMSLRLFTAEMWHTREISTCRVSVQFVPPAVARVGSTRPCAGPTSHPPQLRLFWKF